MFTEDTKPLEVWKTVPGYSQYEVSDQGRVRRSSATCVSPAGKILSPFLMGKHPCEYACVGLSVEGHKKHFKVHILVMLAFVGECPDGMEIRHLDGNTENNTLGNLKYGTHEENSQDTIKHGKSSAKITEQQVIEIRRKKEHGYHRTSLAAEFGLSCSAIDNITSRRTWSHV